MTQYEEKYDFINKALPESITHITEMTKTDHPMVAAKCKAQPCHALLGYPFCNMSAHTEAMPTREGM